MSFSKLGRNLLEVLTGKPTNVKQQHKSETPESTTISVPNETIELTRRNFLKTGVALAGIGVINLPSLAVSGGENSITPETEIQDNDIILEEYIETFLTKEILNEDLINGFGLLLLTDAMQSIARQEMSLTESILKKIGFPIKDFHDHSGKDTDESTKNHHEHYFPTANVILIGLLNGLRIASNNPKMIEASKHAFHEVEIGAGMLGGLTLAIGEGTKFNEVSKSLTQYEIDNWEEELAKIFQRLTLGTTLTQVPATSFGTANAGNNSLKKLTKIVDTIFSSLLPKNIDCSTNEIILHLKNKLSETSNPKLQKILQILIEKTENGANYEELEICLKERKKYYLNSIYSGSMVSTDSLAAPFGDLGPLIGLAQCVGLKEAMKTAVSTLPFTFATDVDRYIDLSKRAGIPIKKYLNKQYLQEIIDFSIQNWTALFMSGKIVFNDTRRSGKVRNSGAESSVEYDMIKTTMDSLKGILIGIVESMLGTAESLGSQYSGRIINQIRLEEIIRDLQKIQDERNREVGRMIIREINIGKEIDTTKVKEIERSLEKKKVPFANLKFYDLLKKLEETNNPELLQVLKSLESLGEHNFRMLLGKIDQFHSQEGIFTLHSLIESNPDTLKVMKRLAKLLSVGHLSLEESTYSIKDIFYVLKSTGSKELGDMGNKYLKLKLNELDQETKYFLENLATLALSSESTIIANLGNITPHDFTKTARIFISKEYSEFIRSLLNLTPVSRKKFLDLAQLEDPDGFWVQVALHRLAFKPTKTNINVMLDKIANWNPDTSKQILSTAKKYQESNNENYNSKNLIKLLEEHPNLQDLFDINYLTKISGSAAFAETILAVSLQGLSLPFVIELLEKHILNTEAFNKLPLLAQEQTVALLLYIVGGWLDNWAITLVGVKIFGTVIYSNALDNQLSQYSQEFPELNKENLLNYFKENLDESNKTNETHLVNEKYIEKIEIIKKLIDELKQKYPEKLEVLYEIEQNLLKNAETYHGRLKHFAFGIGYLAGEQHLYSDSTHFSLFKDLDFSLKDSLIIQHPLYQAWKFLAVDMYHGYLGQHIETGIFGNSKLNQALLKIDTSIKTKISQRTSSFFPPKILEQFQKINPE